jgi:hypothetical protein
MYIRASSNDKAIKRSATLAIEAIEGTLKMMLEGTTRFSFDTSVYQVGKVVDFDPEKFDPHFDPVQPGEKSVIINPPMVEGDHFKPYTTKPTVVSLDSVKASAGRYYLALQSNRGAHLFN